MSGRDLDPQHLLTATLPDAANRHSPSRASAGEGWDEDPGVQPPLPGVILGELLALTEESSTPLVMHPGHPGALRARSTIDLHGAHIGRQVVLVFEHGDLQRPIVMGVLRQNGNAPPVPAVGQLQIEADGERLLVTAQSQMVMRCGKASITLTQAGKVIIEGTYVSSVSRGINRVKGGSVQIN